MVLRLKRLCPGLLTGLLVLAATPVHANPLDPKSSHLADQVACRTPGLKARNGHWFDGSRPNQACEAVFITGVMWGDVARAKRTARRLQDVDPGINLIWEMGRVPSAFVDRASFEAAVHAGVIPRGLVPADFDFEQFMLVEYQDAQPAPQDCRERSRIRARWKYDPAPETVTMEEFQYLHSGEVATHPAQGCSAHWEHRPVLGRVRKTKRLIRVLAR